MELDPTFVERRAMFELFFTSLVFCKWIEFLMLHLQKEDFHVVEHGSGLFVGGEPHILSLRGPGVWRARLVEAGAEPSTHSAPRWGQVLCGLPKV